MEDNICLFPCSAWVSIRNIHISAVFDSAITVLKTPRPVKSFVFSNLIHQVPVSDYISWVLIMV